MGVVMAVGLLKEKENLERKTNLRLSIRNESRN
jgi:hypothetical protein